MNIRRCVLIEDSDVPKWESVKHLVEKETLGWQLWPPDDNFKTGLLDIDTWLSLICSTQSAILLDLKIGDDGYGAIISRRTVEEILERMKHHPRLPIDYATFEERLQRIPWQYQIAALVIKIADARQVPIKCVSSLDYRDERETPLIPPKVEIWYGGNGLEEDRGKLWNIHYPLSSEWDVERLLSLLYVQQLWAWAIHPQRDAVELPYVLCPPASIEHLAALFILCQGYLAAHDDPRLEGWEALVHAYPEFPAIACAHKEKVRQPGWWLTAFSEAADWKKRLAEEIESLAALKQKGVEKSVIAALIGTFAQGGDSLTLGQDDSADLVYRAYDTLRVLLQQ